MYSQKTQHLHAIKTDFRDAEKKNIQKKQIYCERIILNIRRLFTPPYKNIFAYILSNKYIYINLQAI